MCVIQIPTVFEAVAWFLDDHAKLTSLCYINKKILPERRGLSFIWIDADDNGHHFDKDATNPRLLRTLNMIQTWVEIASCNNLRKMNADFVDKMEPHSAGKRVAFFESNAANCQVGHPLLGMMSRLLFHQVQNFVAKARDEILETENISFYLPASEGMRKQI